MNTQDLNNLILDAANADRIVRVETLLSLWRGYGTIERIFLSGGACGTVILKHIELGAVKAAEKTVSHRRKHTSYLVEIEWYQRYGGQCDGRCRVPDFLASAATDDTLVMVLEDMDTAGFPLRREHLSPADMDACLFWLANFHATFLQQAPEGLWETGTYWHLGTRGEEFRVMPKGPLKKRAHKLDDKLRSAAFQTLVHGDAKPENFCFSREGWVAAVDFQYVGRGPGIKDVAYFLWGISTQRAAEMLEVYFAHLRAAIQDRHPGIDVDALEAEWRGLYPAACDDFERFLAGWFILRR